MDSAARRAAFRPMGTISSSFLTSFRDALLEERNLAANLRGAAHGTVLGPWTELLTTAVAQACRRCGWEVAAKGVSRSPLPFPTFECLGLDVTAFEPGEVWRQPIAAFELENANAFDKAAYSLWKVASVRTELAGLFCFRRRHEEIPLFVTRLHDEVLRNLPPPSGELVVVVGTRAAANTFPDGYFRPFVWRPEAARLISA